MSKRTHTKKILIFPFNVFSYIFVSKYRIIMCVIKWCVQISSKKNGVQMFMSKS